MSKDVKLENPKILVTFPNMGWIRTELFPMFHTLVQDQRYALTFSFPQAVPLENGQAKIVQEILADGYDYWLSIDDDTVPSSNPLDLVEFDKDIIACPTPCWTRTTKSKSVKFLHWSCYDYDPIEDSFREHNPKEGLQEVAAVGGGCMLISSRVFRHYDMQHGCFNRITRGDGTVKYGNDLSFCIRARAAGFKMWAHYDYPCHHIKEVDLMMVMRMCNSAATAGSATAGLEVKDGRDGEETESVQGCAEGSATAPEPQHVGA